MKKLTGFMLLIFVLILAACGGGGDSSSDAGEADAAISVGDDIEGATELSFWTFNELHMDLFEDSATQWNEENPDKPIKLNAQTYPFDQMHNNLSLALQSGTGAPDLADIEIRQFSNFLKGDVQLEPLNEYVEPELKNNVEERFNLYEKDGNYYGIDYHVGATVMYYNQEIMDEAGVDIDSIVTWDDYVEAGKQVVEKTGKSMTTIETTEQFSLFPLISQRGSNYFDENGEVIMDNDVNVETLQFLQDMIYKDEIAVAAPGGFHHSEEYYGFMNDGGAASLMMPIWYMGRFIDYMPDLEGKMQIRPLPVWEEGGNRTAGIGGTGTVVTNQSESTDLAKEFLAYTKLTEEANVKLWTVLGFDPPRFDVWDNEEMQADNKYYSYFHEGIFDMLSEIREEIAPIYYTPDYSSAQHEVESTVLFNVLVEQKKTPQEALTEAAKTVKSKQTE